MARRQGHLVDLPRVPGADDEAAAVGICFYAFNDVGDLVDHSSVFGFPFSPLLAINRAQVSIFVRPFIPNGYAVLVEPLDVGFSLEEPEEFVNDGFEMELLGREARKALLERKAGLRAEHGVGASAGAIWLEFAFFQNQSQQLLILYHGVQKFDSDSACRLLGLPILHHYRSEGSPRCAQLARGWYLR